MKIKLSIILLLFNMFSVFSQEDSCLKEYGKQVITIDSLNKVLKTNKETFEILTDSLKKKQSTIDTLKLDLSKYDKFKNEKNEIELQIQQKTDSLILLTEQKSKLSQNILDEKKLYEQNILDEKGKTKSEILTKIGDPYINNTFDNLILSSNKGSIQRDSNLIRESNELRLLFIDLNIYFEVKALLNFPYDSEKTKKAQIELNKINRQSAYLERLKENIESYKDIYEGFKVCIETISEDDKKRPVKGMGEDVKTQKRNQILTIVSNYIFDYDVNFTDYPYIVDKSFQLIKLKFPNPDNDISNLLKE